MSDIAIQVENLGKLYRLGEIGTGTLGSDLSRTWARLRGKEDPFAKIGEANDRTKKGTSDFVWSLKDVSFDVKQGEVLGIIGRNGAGKSTLLKVLSKVTAPTTGRVKVKGRIASLLEVGTGFHPELTGRENIFLNGAILGMTKTEIRSKFDEIVDFSGVERYIDTPVKRYSSGMYVRLAFAVAAFLEPEILIVDEVLAVGDAEFQKKCLGRMKDVSVNDGRTVLFVSHNMGSMAQLCNTGLYLINGQVEYKGTIEDTIDSYVNQANVTSEYVCDEKGIGVAYFEKISVLKEDLSSGSVFMFNKDIILNFIINVNQIQENLTLSIIVKDQLDISIFSSHFEIFCQKEGATRIKAVIPANTIMPGSYKFNSILHIPNKNFVDSVKELYFSIEDSGSEFSQYSGGDFGRVNIPVNWIK